MLKKIFTCRYIYNDMQYTFCKSSSTFKGGKKEPKKNKTKTHTHKKKNKNKKAKKKYIYIKVLLSISRQ